MKQIKAIYEIVSTISLILLIAFLNIGTVCIIRKYMNYLRFSKYLSYFGMAFIILYILSKFIYKEKFQLKDYFILLLGLLAYISYLYAIRQKVALLGTPNRNEGLLVILTYYASFLVSTTISKKNQKRIMRVFLFTGIFQVVLGTIQTLKITNILGYSREKNWSTSFRFASGTLGNPNFYSTYILMCFMYIYGYLITSKTQKLIIKMIYAILTILFAYGLIIGNTMSCILAFTIVVLVTLLLKINRKNIIKVAISFLAITILAIGTISVIDDKTDHRISHTMNKDIKELIDILQNGITDKAGNNRIYVWKKTLEYVPKYIYTGVGIDNFPHLVNGRAICVYSKKKAQCFDKAHNEYLQILITEGIFTLLVYLALIIYTIYVALRVMKKNKSNHTYALLLILLSYLIQAFFNISVITVAPAYYMIMGFLHANTLKKESPNVVETG